MRSDTKRNRRALLEAAGELVRDGADALTMPAIAARAGVSASTAWRHFPSVDDLMHAYARQQAEDLREAVSTADNAGRDFFARTVDEWVRIVLRGGAALVQFRSRKGFLERTRDADDILQAAHEAWAPALEALLVETEADGGALETAYFLANAMLDPREILDLHDHAGLSEEALTAHLVGALRGALLGWVANGPRLPHG